MIKQNKTKLHFILGSALLLTMAVTGCNNNGEKKEGTKDTTTTPTPPPDTTKNPKDTTMEPTVGNKAPGNDVKPQ